MNLSFTVIYSIYSTLTYLYRTKFLSSTTHPFCLKNLFLLFLVMQAADNKFSQFLWYREKILLRISPSFFKDYFHWVQNSG